MLKLLRAVNAAEMLIPVVVILALGLAPALCQAQESTGVNADKPTTPAEVAKAKQQIPPYIKEVGRYESKGYTVIGPMSVSGFYGGRLSLYTGPRDLTINLAGKKTVFKNKKGVPIQPSAINKGDMVIVCKKGEEVIVYLLGAPGRRGGVAPPPEGAPVSEVPPPVGQ